MAAVEVTFTMYVPLGAEDGVLIVRLLVNTPFDEGVPV
jgi:hypothetical protein